MAGSSSATPILKNELDIVIPTITWASRNFTYLPAASIILAVSNLDRRGIRFSSLRNFSRFCFLLRSAAMLWGSIEGPVWYRYNWFSAQLELLFTKDYTGETDWDSVATPEIFLGKFSIASDGHWSVRAARVFRRWYMRDREVEIRLRLSSHRRNIAVTSSLGIFNSIAEGPWTISIILMPVWPVDWDLRSKLVRDF